MKNKFKNKYVFYLSNNFINLILLISPLIIIFRILKKKEDKKRFKEKFSFFSKKKFKGKFNMVSWSKCW